MFYSLKYRFRANLEDIGRVAYVLDPYVHHNENDDFLNQFLHGGLCFPQKLNIGFVWSLYYYSVCEKINVCFLQNNRVITSRFLFKSGICVMLARRRGILPKSYICVNCSTSERQCRYNSCYFQTVISVRLQIYVNHHLLTKHPPPPLSSLLFRRTCCNTY